MNSDIFKDWDNFSKRISEILSIFLGAGILLFLFNNGCINFSATFNIITSAVAKCVTAISLPWIWLFELVHIYFHWPKPISSNWETIFAISIFHQVRTFVLEMAENGRKRSAIYSMIACFLVCGIICYIIGITNKKIDPFLIILSVSLIYPTLELIRYSIHAVIRPESATRGKFYEFKRRNIRYTMPYLIISLSTFLICRNLFYNSNIIVPIYTTILFLSIATYLLLLEIFTQLRRRARGEHGVRFRDSTVTRTSLLLFAMVGLAMGGLYKDQGGEILNILRVCLNGS